MDTGRGAGAAWFGLRTGLTLRAQRLTRRWTSRGDHRPEAKSASGKERGRAESEAGHGGELLTPVRKFVGGSASRFVPGSEPVNHGEPMNQGTQPGSEALHWKFSRTDLDGYIERMVRHETLYAATEAALAERREQATLDRRTLAV